MAVRLRLQPQAPPAPDGAQGPPRRQGRQPRRDDLGARAPRSSGLHHLDRRLSRSTCDRGWPAALDRRGRTGAQAPRASHGQAARRPRRPAARLGALRGQVLDARHDGHRPQPRPERRVGEGPRRPDRRRALRASTRTAASSPCTAASSSRCPARRFDETLREGEATRPARPPTHRCPSELLKQLVDEYKAIVKAAHRQGLPAGPDRAAPRRGRGRLPKSWNGPRAFAYRDRERIPHDLGTAVNVQAMVFGNRDDNSGTGVGFTRDPATGENKPYGDFLVNAQGEDVVAGIRNTEPTRRPQGAVPRASTRS